MSDTSREEIVARIGKIIGDIDIAMMTTIDEHGHARSRPMGTQKREFDGSVWFFSSANSSKMNDLKRDSRVNLSYASSSASEYLSLSGPGHVVNDRSLIKEMWTPVLRAWFEGADDPEVRLIRVDVEEAEYWDTPGGKVAAMFSLLKGMVTGGGENQGTANERVAL